MERHDLPAVTAPAVQRIWYAASDMTELVNAFLLLARNPTHWQTKTFTTSVNQVLKAQIEKHQHLTNHDLVSTQCLEKAELQVNVPEQVVVIIAANLLRNAYSYTGRGEIIVVVDAYGFSVRDTELGIDDAAKQRLFERYFRASGNDRKGHGIGLSIVKRFCDLYGWTITVEGALGQGTTITITINTK